jgi:hypothetical protein
MSEIATSGPPSDRTGRGVDWLNPRPPTAELRIQALMLLNANLQPKLRHDHADLQHLAAHIPIHGRGLLDENARLECSTRSTIRVAQWAAEMASVPGRCQRFIKIIVAGAGATPRNPVPGCPGPLLVWREARARPGLRGQVSKGPGDAMAQDGVGDGATRGRSSAQR